MSRQITRRSRRTNWLATSEIIQRLEERRLMSAPATPADFIWDSAIVTATTVTLDWTDGTGETGYRVDRWTGTAWVQQGINVVADAETATATGLTAGTENLFRIRAFNATGFSAASTIVRSYTSVVAPVMTAGATTASAATFTWTNIAGEDGYILENSVDAGDTWSEVATTAADTLTFTATNLTPATAYTWRVRGINEAGNGANSVVVARATTLAKPPTPTINTQLANGTGLSVNWGAITGETGVKLERLSGTAFVAVGTTLAADVVTSAVTGLTAGTAYTFRIKSVNAVGDSEASEIVETMTRPAQVTGLTATAASSTRINLAWANVLGEDGYNIERSADAGDTWDSIGLVAADVVALSVGGMTASTSYQFRVSATNDAGASILSAVATRGTLISAPSGFDLSVDAGAVTGTTIKLDWTDGSGETGYKVERLVGTAWTQVGTTTAADIATLTATTLTAGTDYVFRLRAANAAGDSAPSARVSLTTLVAAPTLTATTFSNRQINLAWTNVAGESRYVVERSPDGVAWTAFNVPAEQLTYSMRSLAPNTEYQVRVRGVNGSGAGTNSAIATRRTLLNAPSGLTGVGSTTNTTVNVSWVDGAGETAYKVERLNGAVWALVGSATAADVVTLPVTGLTAGTSNQFRLRSVNAAGDSAPSPTITVWSRTAAPTLTVTPVTSTSVTLAWTNIAGETGYSVERSIDAGDTWTAVGSRSADQLTSTMSGLTPNTAYQFRVRGRNDSGLGTPSTAISRTTTLGAPNDVSAEANGPTSVVVTWGAMTGETGFLVQRRQAGAWVTVSGSSALAVDTASYTVTGLTSNTAYTFRVVAVSAAGNGDGSDEADATTLD